MTHAEVLERSRRALDARPDCHHEMENLGPDVRLYLCSLWGCPACGVVFSIDPHGIIRDCREWPWGIRRDASPEADRGTE